MWIVWIEPMTFALPRQCCSYQLSYSQCYINDEIYNQWINCRLRHSTTSALQPALNIYALINTVYCQCVLFSTGMDHFPRFRTSSSRSFRKHRHAARRLNPSRSYVRVWFGLNFMLKFRRALFINPTGQQCSVNGPSTVSHHRGQRRRERRTHQYRAAPSLGGRVVSKSFLNH